MAHVAGSKMTTPNLAAMFTPNILIPAGSEGYTSEVELQNHVACSNVVEFLIEHYAGIHSAGLPDHVYLLSSLLYPRTKINFIL